MGNGEGGAGNGKWGTGKGEWGMGNGEWGKEMMRIWKDWGNGSKMLPLYTIDFLYPREQAKPPKPPKHPMGATTRHLPVEAGGEGCDRREWGDRSWMAVPLVGLRLRVGVNIEG